VRPLFIGLPLVGFLISCALQPQQQKQTFAGTITDSMCANGDHSRMKMGPTSAECTIACVDAHGASFVLYDGKDVFALSDQKTAEKFAGQRVIVSGTTTADKKTIQVDVIAAAK